jgi:CO/xanthine dehydrogenase FAD-binding subunit
VLLGLPEFDYHHASTIEEARALLAQFGDKARLLAGGTDLLILMKHRRAVPRHLINIKCIKGLSHITRMPDGSLRIGALATARELHEALPGGSISDAAAKLGTDQIRNLGTIGGNLANASPSAEFAPPLLTLDAALICVGEGGERSMPIGEFFLAPGKSALRENEFLTEIRVPAAPEHAHSLYLKHSLRKMDVAMASVALMTVIDGDVCREVKLALGAVAPTPFRAMRAEEILRGQPLDGGAGERQLIEEAARVAGEEASPIDDIRATAGYRREIINRMMRKGLEKLIADSRA